ncbi:MAG: zinc-ribbon domain containing protein [Planctomycetota bacterium]|nr:zinc-ribbon domain containing protein [Planctomycetota bacterium]
MPFEDKTLTCQECNSEFLFSASEQQFYAEKGFANEPRRCPPCRRSRKQQAMADGGREMFAVTCAACGKETQVPFKPTGSRPVYCDDCFRSRRGK